VIVIVIEIDDYPNGTPNSYALEVTAALRRAAGI
jgi:hypothetical protein